MLRTAAGQARPPRARARDPRPLGARGDLRAAARAEPRRADAGASSTARSPRTRALAVHTAWGRTLKDVFQRYKALRGFDQRYQNGFDCQGLWIEVGVERELGLNSKREIEEYGLEEFARRCRDVVVWSSAELTRGSKRLGQWMDWGNDYFTFSDTNIEYIWRFLKTVHERAGSTSATARPSGARAAARRSRRTSSQRATTSTAPTRRSSSGSRCSTGRASRSSSGRRRRGRCRRTSPPRSSRTRSTAGARTASGSAVARYPDETFDERMRGAELVGWRYDGPFDELGPGGARRAPRDPVGRGLARRGHRHRPHRAGLRRRGLRALDRCTTCRCSCRSTSRAASTTTTAGCTGSRRSSRPSRSSATSTSAGCLVEAGLYEHRYPDCWRCHTPLIFRICRRLVHLGRRSCASRCSTRTRPSSGRPSTWASAWTTGSQHGRLEHLAPPLLRAAAAVLPVRVRAPERDRVEGRARGAGAPAALDQLEELRRPWIDAVPIRCE